MTDTFLNRCIVPLALACGSRARKFAQYLALLLFGALAGSAAAGEPLTYDDGDLFLGFRATDRANNYLINIGPPAQFVNAAPGSTFQVNIGNTITDLMTTFGSDWYTRIDPNTAVNAVQWAVTGGWQIATAGDPANTLYSTNPSANPWPRRSDTAQSFTMSRIATMGTTFSGNQPTPNNPNGLIQNAASTNSYASFQPGGLNSGGISFETWNPWNEGGPAVTLFFNRIVPGPSGSGPSTLLGTFTMNSSGQLSYTASGAGTPTPTPTPGGSVTPTPTATPGGSVTPTPTPTGTPGGTVTPTPTPTPGGVLTTLGNISTRLRVEVGDNALFGGFIITGTQPKRIIVRAIGPSLASFFTGVLADPILELRDSSGGLIMSNDNWRSNQEAEIIATGIPPSNNLESAIVQTLPANTSATVIIRGVNNGTGIAVVEAYDLDQTVDSKLANISTRGLVLPGDNAMIAGTIVLGPATQRVLVRALGPSLPVTGKLADPTLELRDGNGALIRANDNWRTDQEQEIIDTTIPPSNNLESAIVATLPANGAAYTAILRGVNDTSGVALVEIYGLAASP